MDFALHEWISLIVRWLHITTAIAWIGSSFYFIWLDLSLKYREGLPAGAKGESWSVHGGGFYNVQKYMVAPEQMPTELHWFKHESYFTWLSGFGLMAVMYYWGAESFLIDPDKMALEPWQAISISVGFLIGGWIVYDQLCKSPLGNNIPLLSACVFVLIVASSWGLSEVFSNRATFLHIGAMIGTMMSGNVFFIIIPNQKIVVEDLKAGREPDAKYGFIAKQRSTHNNYLTLPVLLMMISNHYPVLFGPEQTWAIIALIILTGGVVRNFFNTSHTGATGKALMWQWPVASVLMVVLIMVASYRGDQKIPEEVISEIQAFAIIQTHCTSCHSANSTDEDFTEAPGGIKFDTLDQVRASGARILGQVSIAKIMPLGNKSGMTQQERDDLGNWIRSGMPEE